MKKRREKGKEIPSTNISQHKRVGSVLKPPFRQLERMAPSSWKDYRMPEMLWSILLIGNMEREEALTIFRKIGKFVAGKDNLFDVTHTGIASWNQEERVTFITILKEAHPKAQKILQPLVIFTQLPGYEDWEKVLGQPTDEAEMMDYLVKGVADTLGHQSQEATDCRWVKILCQVLSGKFHIPHERVAQILGYPDVGDMKVVRPFIRAGEIGMNFENEPSKWPEEFWHACLKNTLCAPLPRKNQRKDTIHISHSQIHKIRYLLLLHFMKTDDSTATDPRHDTIFGFGLYALRLLDELVATNLSRGATGRLLLRSCVEGYITLAFLLKKEDPDLWGAFRNYGIGQMKLSYLKARESKNKPVFIDEEFIKQITNEDRWEEFSDIELKNWADSDLRKMSEEAGCKDIYDSYYSWASTFSHSSWGAMRETSFTLCANPLHRLHHIPSVDIYALPGVLEDVVRVTNLILGLIDSQYPDLNCKIKDEPKPEKASWIRELYLRIKYRKDLNFLKFITEGK